MSYNQKHTLIKTPQEGYDLVADQYNKYHDHLDSFEKGTFIRLLPRNLTDANIIDLGAGDGRLFRYFQNINFKTYTACDISQKLLAKHPTKKGVEKETCDLEQPLPFSDNSYNLALSFFVLEHIENLDQLFGETYRILKSGGSWIIGYFLQRRAFERKANQEKFKIQLFNHKLEELKKIAEYHFFEFTEYPVYEKGELLGWIIVCRKP